MKLLFLGDIMGRAGREAIAEHLPTLKGDLKPDMIIANGENAAAGFGISSKICKELYELGVDIITSGNHIWGQKETITYINEDPKLLRPANYSNPSLPGRGVVEHRLKDDTKVIVMNIMGRLFMKDHLDCPFYFMEDTLKKYTLSNPSIRAIIVDIHAETTSEKMAMGQFLDGRVSFIVGSHTHIPTADARIFDKGTAYQTDAGMCGDYNSVIGMKTEVILPRFLGKVGTPRMEPALGPGTMCGTYVDIDDRSGLAKEVKAIRMGPYLEESR